MSALPGFLSPTRTLTFASSGGIQLYGEWFAAPEPKGLAVIVHGYAEHCGRYREVANVLVQRGFAVFSYDMRGHGKATGTRGHVHRFTEYLDDLDAAIAQGRQLAGKDLRRALVAHSNGSLITLRALTDPARRPDVLCAVVSSPFLALRLQVPAVKRLAAKIASRIYPSLALPNDLKLEDLTSDLEKQEARRVDTLCHGVATARFFTEAAAAQAYVYEHAARVAVPTLWLVGGDDPIADPSRSKAVHARITAPSTYHDLVGLKHEVLNERDRGRLFGLLGDFVVEKFR